ncbi:hypothetical protein RN001_011442 [Aquatica leii]|uniref:Uncharacterized protein n=1 Tax=Aquatica leii TaxID=1421715 RepID=A0AAN7NXE4_9COLE|nr:hypothetical protein RN001_011442 [Aquatica leii]
MTGVSGRATAAEVADTVMMDGDTVIGPTVIFVLQVVAQGDDLDAIAKDAWAGARLQADRDPACANIQDFAFVVNVLNKCALLSAVFKVDRVLTRKKRIAKKRID